MSERELFGQHTSAESHQLEQYGEQVLRHTQADSIAIAKSMLVAGGNQLVDPTDFLFTHTFKGERYFFFRSKKHGVVSLREGVGEMVYAEEGRQIFEQIAQTYRPNEGVALWESFRPTDIAIALTSSKEISVAGDRHTLVEMLGEGFESVALRTRDARGRYRVVKIGKIDLADNYRVMRPLLVEMSAQGLRSPSYLDYDQSMNAILMEDAGPQTLEFKMRVERDDRTVLQSILKAIGALKSLKSRLDMHHGDPAAANLIVQSPEVALIDFRFSPTIPFNSEIYRRRDVFTIMYTLYQFLYGKQALCVLETKNSIHRLESPAQPLPEHMSIIYPTVQRHHALQEFLQHNLYRPEGVDLHALETLVAEMLKGE